MEYKEAWDNLKLFIKDTKKGYMESEGIDKFPYGFNMLSRECTISRAYMLGILLELMETFEED